MSTFVYYDEHTFTVINPKRPDRLTGREKIGAERSGATSVDAEELTRGRSAAHPERYTGDLG